MTEESTMAQGKLKQGLDIQTLAPAPSQVQLGHRPGYLRERTESYRPYPHSHLRCLNCLSQELLS